MSIEILNWAPQEKEKLDHIKEYIKEDLTRAYGKHSDIHKALDVVQEKLRWAAPLSRERRRKFEFVANEAAKEWLESIGKSLPVQPVGVFDVLRGFMGVQG